MRSLLGWDPHTVRHDRGPLTPARGDTNPSTAVLRPFYDTTLESSFPIQLSLFCISRKRQKEDAPKTWRAIEPQESCVASVLISRRPSVESLVPLGFTCARDWP